MLVDGYDFAAYESAGFGRFDEVDPDVAKQVAGQLGAPEMGGWKGWLNYFSIVSKVSPIPSDMKFGQVPEGVLRVGGTFVVKGNEIVYRWSDVLPGNHPNVTEVAQIAQEAAAQKDLPFALPKLFGW